MREGAHAAVVDPGDAAPVLAYLEREGLALTRDPRRRTTMAITSAAIAALLARFPVPVFGPARETIPGRTQALAEGDAITVPGIGLDASRARRPGPHGGPHRATSAMRRRRRSRSSATRCSPAAAGGCSKARRRRWWTSLAKLAALPGDTRVYCGHEYTLANLRFALAVEPGNAALRARQRASRPSATAGEPTVPSTIAEERATNPFLRAQRAGGPRRGAAHAGRALADAVDAFAALREWKNGFR